jgi:hypothetical protein
MLFGTSRAAVHTVSAVVVILPDDVYGVRRREHPAPRDADGTPVLSAPGVLEGPWPGASRELSADSWSFRLDPLAWPLRAGDLVVSGERVWVVQGRPKLFQNNAAPDVDYVAATATLSPEEIV